MLELTGFSSPSLEPWDAHPLLCLLALELPTALQRLVLVSLPWVSLDPI